MTKVEKVSFPSWAAFNRDYVEDGIPHLYKASAAPEIVVVVDQGAARLAGRFEAPDAQELPLSPFDEIRLTESFAKGRRTIEISTLSRALYQPFYDLIEIVASRTAAGDHPLDALSDAAAVWKRLLKQAAVLSDEQQAGLYGELWFLQRLLDKRGPEGLAAWTGPLCEAHDFRLSNREFEVKTTVRNRRIHTINGISQLEASPGCSLHLLSLQLADGGSGGHALGAMVDETLKRLPTAIERDRLLALLNMVGYRHAEARRYTRRFKLRTAATLIEVVDGVPRLTTDALAAVPDRFVPSRFGRVVYEIDVDGLGLEESDPEFVAVLSKDLETKVSA